MIYYFSGDLPKGTDEHAFTRAILKALLKDAGITDLRIIKDERQKPYLASREACISLTHTAGFYAAAVSKRNIGIDAESESRNIPESVFKRICAAHELKSIENPVEAYTKKEAEAKYSGEGLAWLLKKEHLKGAEFTVLHLDGYVLSVCEKRRQLHKLKRITLTELDEFI